MTQQMAYNPYGTSKMAYPESGAYPPQNNNQNPFINQQAEPKKLSIPTWLFWLIILVFLSFTGWLIWYLFF